MTQSKKEKQLKAWTGRQSNGILIIVSPDGITPGSVDFDLIYSVGNVQLD